MLNSWSIHDNSLHVAARNKDNHMMYFFSLVQSAYSVLCLGMVKSMEALNTKYIGHQK
jgi:hypothetical protein